MPFHSEKQQIFGVIQDEIERFEKTSKEYLEMGMIDDFYYYKNKKAVLKELLQVLEKKFS